MVASVKVREGIKINGPIQANWEKPPTNIVVEAEKVGMTLAIRGTTEIVQDTKDWEVRKGASITC